MPRTGFRRLTAGHLAARDAADAYTGLPEGFTHQDQLIQDAERCGKRLPWPSAATRLLRVLLTFTQKRHWTQRDERPQVWKTNAELADCIARDERTVIYHLAALEAAGAIHRCDHLDGRRIIDLSPLAHLAPQLRAIAREEDERRRRVRIVRAALRRACAAVVMAADVLEDEAAPVALRDEVATIRDRVEEVATSDEAVADPGGTAERLDELAQAAGAVAQRYFEALRNAEKISSPLADSVTHTPTHSPRTVLLPVGAAGACHEGVGSEGWAKTPPPATISAYRRLVFGAAPWLRQILTSHGHDAAEAGNYHFLLLLDELRRRLRVSPETVQWAQARHGLPVTLAALVVAATRPAAEVRKSRAAIFAGMARKAPAELNPWPSLHRAREAAAPDEVPAEFAEGIERLPLDAPTQAPAVGEREAAFRLLCLPENERELWAALAAQRLGAPVDPIAVTAWAPAVLADFVAGRPPV